MKLFVIGQRLVPCPAVRLEGALSQQHCREYSPRPGGRPRGIFSNARGPSHAYELPLASLVCSLFAIMGMVSGSYGLPHSWSRCSQCFLSTKFDTSSRRPEMAAAQHARPERWASTFPPTRRAGCCLRHGYLDERHSPFGTSHRTTSSPLLSRLSSTKPSEALGVANIACDSLDVFERYISR